ncbi:hypothetical protein BD626DRAFT_434670 [Schizophyllum amplum]|uniref:TPR-like protein n=1 Tax=Schizophyllum amplum TaxID=97359 RepID=A0A550C9C1_9AGAR|nr:hypothetical protein BD626DRAFT_434670 [Auriculariopsis ampla]
MFYEEDLSDGLTDDDEEVGAYDESDSEDSSDDALDEPENDQDFDRLVQNIRQNAKGESSGIAQNWDLQLEAQNAEFRDDLKAASGIGKRKKGGRRGPRTGPPLSHQVRTLLGDGNQAYVDADLPLAIRLMSEAIRIEPRAAPAWTVLAQCYADLGQPTPALHLRIMAAHLRRDPDEWARLAVQSREAGLVQQALYCYAKLAQAEPENVDALWDRAALARSCGDLRAARASLVALLRRVPHDLSVLAELRPVLIELGDLGTCAGLYDGALEHYMHAVPAGVGSPFSMMEILVLADLHNALGAHAREPSAHERAVHAIRKGMRWLQGRADQSYWDAVPDDREFDPPPPDGPTRAVGEGEMAPGYFSLDVNTRQRLAVARIRMGDVDEGKIHATIVLSEDPTDYAVLFGEIADAYFDRELWAEARPIYEVLGGDVATSSIQVLMQAAACYHMLGELQEAAEVYESVIQADPTLNDAKMKLANIYEATGEVHKAYDLVCQVIDSRKRRPRDPGASVEGSAEPASASLFQEQGVTTSTRKGKQRTGLTRAQLLELEVQREKEAAQGWNRVRDLWGAAVAAAAKQDTGAADNVDEGAASRDAALREWMLEAEKLIEMFRETRRLFTTDRHSDFKGLFRMGKRRKRTAQETEAEEDRMASRLQLDLEGDSVRKVKGGAKNTNEKVEHFRTIHFDDWLRMTMQYCFFVTREGDYALAEEILRHMMLSNAYVALERQNTLRIALATCAIAAKRYDTVVEQTRKIIYVHQFNTEPIRLLLAALSSGMRPTDAFIRSTLQKFFFREMKLRDAAVNAPDQVRWVPNRRWTYAGAAGKGAEEDEEDKDADGKDGAGVKDRPALPKVYNPVNMIAYGMTCVAAKSYQSALVYLLHAYDYSPDDPVLCLLLAIASFGRAMQRQADNRHHLIVQGLAFLSKYRAARRGVRGSSGEADYNFGRAFQQLGLFSQAVTHYERVLKRAEEGENVVFVREAAYNLSLIYSVTGARPLAEALYRKWLVI